MHDDYVRPARGRLRLATAQQLGEMNEEEKNGGKKDRRNPACQNALPGGFCEAAENSVFDR